MEDQKLVDEIIALGSKIDNWDTLAYAYINLLMEHGNVSERARKLIHSCLVSRIPY